MVARGSGTRSIKKITGRRNESARDGLDFRVRSLRYPVEATAPKPRQHPPRCWRGFQFHRSKWQPASSAAKGAATRGEDIADNRSAGPYPPARSQIRRRPLRRDRPQFRCRHAAPAPDADERRRAGAGHRRVPQGGTFEQVRCNSRPPARPLLAAVSGFVCECREQGFCAHVELVFTQVTRQVRPTCPSGSKCCSICPAMPASSCSREAAPRARPRLPTIRLTGIGASWRGAPARPCAPAGPP